MSCQSYRNWGFLSGKEHVVIIDVSHQVRCVVYKPNMSSFGVIQSV